MSDHESPRPTDAPRRGSSATTSTISSLPHDNDGASRRGSMSSSALTDWRNGDTEIPAARVRRQSSPSPTPASQPPTGSDQRSRARSPLLGSRQPRAGYGALGNDDNEPLATPLAAAVATNHLELTPFIVTDQNDDKHVVVIISKQRFDNEKRAQTLSHFRDHWALIGHKVTEGLGLLQAAPPLLNIVVRMTLVPYSVSALATGSGLSNETVNTILANPGISPLFKTTMTLVGALDNPISSTIVAAIPLSLFAIYLKRLKTNANREGLNWRQWAPIAAQMFFTRICPPLVIFGSAAIYRLANQANLSTQAQNTMIDGLACPAYFQTRGFFDVSSSLALCMAVSAPVELLVGLGIATGAYFIYRGVNNVIELACMRKASKVNAQTTVNLSQPPRLEELANNNPQQSSMISKFFRGIVDGLKSAAQAVVSAVSPRAAAPGMPASATGSRPASPSVLPGSTAAVLAATSSTMTPSVTTTPAAQQYVMATVQRARANSTSSTSSSASSSHAALHAMRDAAAAAAEIPAAVAPTPPTASPTSSS